MLSLPPEPVVCLEEIYQSLSTGLHPRSPLLNGLPTSGDVEWVLRGVTCYIKAGERVGIIGGNGSGKSTLLKVIAGMHLPQRGRVKVNAQVSPLFSTTYSMQAKATVTENVRFLLLWSGVKLVDAQEAVRKVLEIAGLESHKNMRFDACSKGMKMRLGLATAMLTEPDLLLVDEVLNAGDLVSSIGIRDYMEEFLSKSRAMVFASHSYRLLRIYCNRLIWLRSGQIEMDGQVEEVLQKYDLWVKRNSTI